MEIDQINLIGGHQAQNGIVLEESKIQRSCSFGEYPVDRYKEEGVIGEGSYGVVAKAFDTKTQRVSDATSISTYNLL